MPPLETLYIVLTISAACITVFLCWALFEVARFMRQSNDLLSDTRQKVAEVEAAISRSFNIFSLLAEGGKAALALLAGHKSKKRRGRWLEDEEE